MSEAWASEHQRTLSQQDSRVVRAAGNGALEVSRLWLQSEPLLPSVRLLSATALISEQSVAWLLWAWEGHRSRVREGLGRRLCTRVPSVSSCVPLAAMAAVCSGRTLGTLTLRLLICERHVTPTLEPGRWLHSRPHRAASVWQADTGSLRHAPGGEGGSRGESARAGWGVPT